jgi:hypothetical protein
LHFRLRLSYWRHLPDPLVVRGVTPPMRRMIRRREDESWGAQSSTTVCFAGSYSEPIGATRDTKNTVRKRTAAKRARRRAGALGWPNRRTKTTSGARRMWRGCSRGGWLTRGTGDDQEAKEVRRQRRRWRYKISPLLKRLKSLKIRKACRNLRYKISGAINRLF